MNANLRKAQQRAAQYWFIDGLAEIGGGLIAILLGLLFWIQSAASEAAWTNLIFFFLAFGGAFAIRWVIQRRKDRSTTPRTGYIEYTRGWENRKYLAVVVVFAMLILVLQIALVLQGPRSLTWMPLIGGLIFAFIFGWAAYTTRLKRLGWLAIFCLFCGGLLSFAGIGDLRGAALLSALTGVVLLVFGNLTRRAYLRSNPLVEVSHER